MTALALLILLAAQDIVCQSDDFQCMHYEQQAEIERLRTEIVRLEATAGTHVTLVEAQMMGDTDQVEHRQGELWLTGGGIGGGFVAALILNLLLSADGRRWLGGLLLRNGGSGP